MTNTLKLKAKILENGKTLLSLSKEMGISINGLSKKVNNKNEFTISEVTKIKDLLNLSSADVMDIFFSSKMCL